MAKEIVVVVAVIIALCIPFTMFSGCIRTPEEEFELFKENATFTQGESWYILKYQSDALMLKNGHNVKDSFISAYYMEEIPVVKYYVLYEENGEEKVEAFGFCVNHEEALVICITEGTEVVRLENGKNLYMPDYLRSLEYCLVDGEIILS